ncbi:zinc-dependent alcohol dehydrogenase family protein [Kitasatospora acidiphila]|uniref:Zinc-dependent alcohol dehydrogenase family protein n=1 Tax=Kitasatospora acidiphila TaxID=2567942 RepID=A0A540WDA4_9ACTN|nr:zinc-dependent alcohol dehydrogenase family protein [Kitasatospora acidiphila]TQF06996.1 zinc-dependent alcohol dehydrogenase family protein [Kitasatospora acidiphila]
MTKAVLFHELGGPEVMRLQEVTVGEPGPGEVRIRVDAIGLNRAEVLFRTGHYIEAVRQFPARLGTEAAGVVEAVGDGVTDFRPGQPVSTVPGFSQNDYGIYAEQALVPAGALLHRPEELDPVAGASVWMPYLTAYGALMETGGMRPGDTVLVNAASSSTGLAAIHLANRIGARAIALTRTEAKKEALLKEGAAEVIATEQEDVAARVRAATDGRGAEFVFDAVAGPGITELARLVAPEGTHIVYGALSGEPTPYPGIELGLPALAIRSYTMHEVSRHPERLRRAEAFIIAGLRSGAFRSVVDRTFELDHIVDAHRHLESNAQIGKIVVTVPR